MPPENKQSKLNSPGVYTDAVTRVKNELTANQSTGQKRNSKLDKKHILLLLFIMLLVVAQVVILMAGSGFNAPPESVEGDVVTLDDIKAVNDDFKEVMKSIDEIKIEPDTADVDEQPVEVEKISAPVAIKEAKPTRKPDIAEPEKVMVKTVKPVPAKKSPVLLPIASSKKEILTNETIRSVVEIKPDYIKYDNEGKLLDDNVEQWSCVQDTETGLVWEVKSQGDAMRNSKNLYSWYNPEHKALPGKSDGGRCEGDTDCDTNAYVQAMNERNYCGHNDWRLPTREQMKTLVDLENGKDKVKINKLYFPQTVPSWYWTSSDEDIKAEYAWYVLFRNGFALSDLKERPKHIRLVRKKSNDSNGGSNVY